MPAKTPQEPPVRRRGAAPAAQPEPPAKEPKGGKSKGGKSKPAAVQKPAGEWEALKVQIAAERGENIVSRADSLPAANHIPTGAFTLDFSLLGGIPEGFATMIYGVDSAGKTTMALKAVAGFHRKHPDKIAVWMDPENLFDADWAEQLGCDLKRLEVVRAVTGEEVVDLMVAAMDALEVGFVVLDSVPGCVPKDIVERSAEDDTRALLARLMGKLCSKMLMSWSRERRRGHRVTVVYLNQNRVNMAPGSKGGYIRPGGRQINHTPTTKIAIRNQEVLGEDARGNEVVDYNDHSFKIDKAKHGASIRNGAFQMVVNPDKDPAMPQGTFDDYATVVTFCKRFGLLGGSGGAYRLPLFTGQTFKTYDAIHNWFKADPASYAKVRASIIAMQRMTKGLVAVPPDGYLEGPGVRPDIPALSALLAAGQLTATDGLD